MTDVQDANRYTPTPTSSLPKLLGPAWPPAVTAIHVIPAHVPLTQEQFWIQGQSSKTQIQGCLFSGSAGDRTFQFTLIWKLLRHFYQLDSLIQVHEISIFFW